LEPREQEDVNINHGFETIQVEMKEKGKEKDAKDGNECLIGEEEIRKYDDKSGEYSLHSYQKLTSVCTFSTN